MRASLYLIGFAAASLLGAGVAGIGCSSSSSPPATTPPEDASTTPDSAVTPPEDTGTPATDTGTACTPLFDASAATIATPIVPGEASWTCLETACASTLQPCAADCTCNNDILTALSCLAPPDGGMLATCFGPVLSSTNATDIAVLGCLQMNMGACMGDGGAPSEAGTTPEAGPDAGDGG
jgi:hypothetical protein